MTKKFEVNRYLVQDELQGGILGLKLDHRVLWAPLGQADTLEEAEKLLEEAKRRECYSRTPFAQDLHIRYEDVIEVPCKQGGMLARRE